MQKSLRAAFFLLVLLFSAGASAADMVRLRILETTDLHANMMAYDYYQDRPEDGFGLERTAGLIAQARTEVANTLLFDNGDTIQGSPLGDWAAQNKIAPHPVYQVMAALGYDAVTLGNHEFNYGLEYLGKVVSAMPFPVVSSNVFYPDGRPFVETSLILDRRLVDEKGAAHPVRIGVLGVVPPQILSWDKEHLEGRLVVRDMAESLAASVPPLRKAGADLVVVLAHTGFSTAPHVSGEASAATSISKIPGIDAILSGHSHQRWPGDSYPNLPGADRKRGTVNGVPVVMAGSWGSDLGIIDMTLSHQDGRWSVVESRSELRPITQKGKDGVKVSAESNPVIVQAAAAYHEKVRAFMSDPIGETTVPLTSYFSLVGDSAALQVINDAQRWYGRQLVAGTPHEGKPLLSAASPFKAGGKPGVDYYVNIPAGPLALRHAADLYSYSNNTIRVVELTGAQLADWLEASVRLYRRIDPLEPQEQSLVDEFVPSYVFDVIDGVTYTVDVTQPQRFGRRGVLLDAKARRISNLRYQGRPVSPEDRFLVVTNNYRAEGGDFPHLDGSTVVASSTETNRDVLATYLRQQGRVSPTSDGNWRFAPWPDTVTVTVNSSPLGKDFLPADGTVTPFGPAQAGFWSYRVRAK